jgi:hypothetical protein
MYDSEYQDIVKRVNNRYRRRVVFLINAGLFGVMFMSSLTVPTWNRGSLYALMAVWGVVLLVHFAWLLLAGARDRAIQREVERARAASVPIYHDVRAYDRLSAEDSDEMVELDAAYMPKRKRR